MLSESSSPRSFFICFPGSSAGNSSLLLYIGNTVAFFFISLSFLPMDSGNSTGSMQSSSGGDEDYNPRDESVPAFFTSSTSNPQQPHSHHHHNHPSSLPDPVSDYLNTNMVWPRGRRSESSCTAIDGLTRSPSAPLPSDRKDAAKASASLDQTSVVRTSKKRPRASRRAPTTVLNTDISNFRSMVQEFTGIPAPPFSASPLTRSRLNLSCTATNIRSSQLDTAPPSYFLRPFAHKVQPPSFLSSSPFSDATLVDAIASDSSANSTSSASIHASSSNSNVIYQQTYDLALPKQIRDVSNMPNPILSFESLLPTSEYPLSNPTIFGAKSQVPFTTQWSNSHPKTGVLQGFGMSHGAANSRLSEISSLLSLEEPSLSGYNPLRWGDGEGFKWNDGDQVHSDSPM